MQALQDRSRMKSLLAVCDQLINYKSIWFWKKLMDTVVLQFGIGQNGKDSLLKSCLLFISVTKRPNLFLLGRLHVHGEMLVWPKSVIGCFSNGALLFAQLSHKLGHCPSWSFSIFLPSSWKQCRDWILRTLDGKRICFHTAMLVP